jgi:isopentenyl diphosphate isomerase/L-lactate dehydrogenase-like FMN-dependent dehydrogenase
MKSGATDEYSKSKFPSVQPFPRPSILRSILTPTPALRLNRSAFNSILFRPRILIDVEACDTSCEMMGQKTSLPIFISPAGMAGLAHPLAERGLAASAGECGIIQMASLQNPLVR